MATLVLSVVGQVVGGPVGGMIGATVGQYIDQNILFKPKAQHGPRLNELAVQASQYGAQIPRIYGQMRVAGQVIWALPLKETRHKQSAKGRADQISYTYSASFAVALSSRRLRKVKRIWADGTLIRKVDGSWTRDAVMRFHTGGADQALDPLIASAEGMEAVPAHRGLAYVVFEDLPLADYGNRIPLLTFEVEAEAEIDAGAVAADVLPAFDAPDAVLALQGYAASGETVRSALAPLTDAVGWILGRGGLVAGGEVGVVDETAIQAANEPPVVTVNRGGADAIPVSMAVRHYDPARDYQIGMQRARLAGATGLREASFDLPAVLSSENAKALAERLAARAGDAPHRLTVPVGPQALAMPPGCLLHVPEQHGVWRLTHWQWEGASGTIELVRYTDDIVAISQADPGRSQASPLGSSGALHLVVIDLPGWQQGGASVDPLVGVFVASEVGRGGILANVTSGDGTQAISLGRVMDSDALGYADTILGHADPALFDDVCTVEVTLVNAEMTLSHASDAALLAGANIAMLGRELIQFGRAEPLGGERYRISHLLRGRGGTEGAIAGHAAGEAFILLPDDPQTIALLPAQIGLLPLAAGMTVHARRAGSDQQVVAEVGSAVTALRPLSPVHMRAQLAPGGNLAIHWIRRSRTGWLWVDDRDAPIGEAREHYTVEILPSVGTARTVEVMASQLEIAANDIAAWRLAGANQVAITVAQIGTYAVSPKTSVIFPL